MVTSESEKAENTWYFTAKKTNAKVLEAAKL
jgi:hypothetical protein